MPERDTLSVVGDRVPTLAPSESVIAGVVQARNHTDSFGRRALDLADNSLGDGMPQMSDAVRGSVAAIIDSGIEQALRAVQQAASADANASAVASRWIIRALGVGTIALAFTVVGVLIWSLGKQVDKTATAAAATQAQVTAFVNTSGKESTAAAAHRAELAANVKMLAAHAVTLTGNVNKTGKANYEMLGVIVDKLGARGDVPALHEPPTAIEVPVTLRYVAGER